MNSSKYLPVNDNENNTEAGPGKCHLLPRILSRTVCPDGAMCTEKKRAHLQHSCYRINGLLMDGRMSRTAKCTEAMAFRKDVFQHISCLETLTGCLNPLTLNDPYRGRTAPLTSKRCILYIYSTNIGTEYFKHSIYSPFFSLQNAVCFIILTYLVPVLFTFYIQGVLKFKKIIPEPKG